MRIVVNDTLVEKRAAAARRAVTLGLFLMFGAMMFSFRPPLVLPAYGIMLLGVILLNWGGRTGAKWLRKPRVDQTLGKALKGLNHGCRLYSYLLPAEHVILSPTGLFVLKAKTQDGEISCRGEKWHRPFRLGHLLRVFSEERLGNPGRQVQGETEKMHRFVTSHLPDVDVPMQPLIVFVDPKATLNVAQPTVPVMPLRDLKAHLRKAAGEQRMPRETEKALIELFDELA